MPVEKRKTKTSTAVKYRYNSKHYKQFNVQIKPEVFDAIDTFCKAKGISRSQFPEIAVKNLSE